MLLVVKAQFMIERTNLHNKKGESNEKSRERKASKEDCGKRKHLRNQSHLDELQIGNNRNVNVFLFQRQGEREGIWGKLFHNSA